MTMSLLGPQAPPFTQDSSSGMNKFSDSFSSQSTLVSASPQLEVDVEDQTHTDDNNSSSGGVRTRPSHEASLDPMAHLAYTRTGSVRLTDQNAELRMVIQQGILEVKAYIAFEHGYPEIVSKNSYARKILLTAALHCKTAPIEKRMRTDEQYLSVLAGLVCVIYLASAKLTDVVLLD